jgi:hypothetical protein
MTKSGISTVDELTARLTHARAVARGEVHLNENGDRPRLNASVAVRLTLTLGKLHGLIVDEVEFDYVTPAWVQRMSDEELEEFVRRMRAELFPPAR